MTSERPSFSYDLGDFLPYQLSIASNAVSGRIAQLYRERFALKVGEWRIMAVLGQGDDRTQRDLSEATLMDKVAVNRACKGLENRALIVRRPNPKDGRSHRLSLTEEGWAIYRQVMPMARDAERRLFEGFTAAEQGQLRDLLLRLRAASGTFAPELG